MGHPGRLYSALSAYFNTQVTPTSPPTFEGLALCAGFSSFAQLRAAVVDDSHPQLSRDHLVIALTRIADHYQQNGLLETLNPTFIKYLLSAYLNISEKHETTAHETSDRTITVRWVEDSPNSTSDLVDEARTKASLRAASTSKQALADELAELSIEDIL